jgi:hypothetical protein
MNPLYMTVVYELKPGVAVKDCEVVNAILTETTMEFSDLGLPTLSQCPRQESEFYVPSGSSQ